MKSYELTIEEDGSLVLPVDVRQTLGIENGGWVTIKQVGDVLKMSRSDPPDGALGNEPTATDE